MKLPESIDELDSTVGGLVVVVVVVVACPAAAPNEAELPPFANSTLMGGVPRSNLVGGEAGGVLFASLNDGDPESMLVLDDDPPFIRALEVRRLRDPLMFVSDVLML